MSVATGGTVVYIDSIGGVAGDMLLAALLDAGASEDALRELPERLGLTGVDIELERVQRHAISALHIDVIEGPGGHEHRSWRSIQQQVAAADLDEAVRSTSLGVLERLANAEAQVHGIEPDDVHFHEIGAVDTLIDVVGVVTLLAAIGPSRIVCSPLPMGHGTVRAAHGVLPLPAPATAELLVGVPVYGVALSGETVTPTGAALVATLADEFGSLPAMTLRRVGYGAGTADFAARANLVRVMVGTGVEAAASPAGAAAGEAVLLETNLDDLNPELIPDAAEACFAAGALDVWSAPAMMKKGRPGVVFSTLVRPEAQEAVASAMLRNTSALGVRVVTLRRYELEREHRTVVVDGDAVRVKLGRLHGEIVNVAPEHDDCAAVARSRGVPVNRFGQPRWRGGRVDVSDLSELEACVGSMETAVVAFSGGVDSSLVAAVAARVLGVRALAVTAVSPALASGELDGARAVAAAVGVAHRVIRTDEMARPGYRRNDRFRCYHCKTELYDQLSLIARAEGYAVVLSGANADDVADWRPGLTAAG